MSTVRLSITLALLVACKQMSLPESNGGVKQPGDLERVLAFAVKLEVEANGLKNRKDVCLGFGSGLVADHRQVFSELRHSGIRIRPNEWCMRGARGLSVAIVAPVREAGPDLYEVEIQLGDNSIHPGTHFATLLSRGTYVVSFKRGSGLHLVSHTETCCTKAGPP